MDQMWSFYVEKFFNGKLDGSCEAKEAFESLREFSRTHRTFIILNGGDHNALTDLYELLEQSHPYAYDKFHEPGLNDALTSVVVVLPERMYDETASKLGRALASGKAWKDDPMFTDALTRDYTAFELELLRRKAMCPLAS